MKKRLLTFATIIVFILAICAFNYKWICYRFYPFDRITGEYEISVNGKEIDAVDEYYEYEIGERIRLENNTENFKIKGGAYGNYTIGFVLKDDTLYQLTRDEKFIGYGDVDLSIDYFNTNWWHISSLDMEFDIVEENGEWYVCCDVQLKEPTEDFKIITSNTSRKIKLDEIKKSVLSIGP
ncbi:MAG: hypothetical protein II997_02855 [Clostridia bacterium]|nr:hypothetical protein [Oscillospiraceae bacterium]MBQ4517507.1 hypothetical protein [Clostridia bacterium]